MSAALRVVLRVRTKAGANVLADVAWVGTGRPPSALLEDLRHDGIGGSIVDVDLTEAQLGALRRLGASQGDVHFERHFERQPAAVLVRHGLAHNVGFCRLGFLGRLSKAGRQVLDALEGKATTVGA